MTTKKIQQISLYGSSHQRIKKDKWNENLLGEFDSHDGISNVVPCLVNIYETNLIYILDELITLEYTIQMKLLKVNAPSERNLE
jgi:hypothetical protein